MGWQDKAIRVDTPPTATGGWQSRAIRVDPPPAAPPAPPADPIGLPMPPGGTYGPPVPQPDNSFLGRTVRGLKVGSQAVGSGIADLLGTPVDVANAGTNLGLAGIDKLAEALGGNFDYRISDPVGGSNSIRNAAAEGITAAFGPGALVDHQDMTPHERILSDAERFAAANLAGSGLLSKFRDLAPRGLAAPYVASGSDARVLAGDAAAGLGSGALLGAYHEYAPQYVQDKLGGLGDLAAAFGGGIGGARLMNAGESIASKMANVPSKLASVPEHMIPIDPETALPVKRSDMARAAQMVQQQAYDPAAASAEISRYLDTAGDGAHPTSALITADPGLNAVERRLRAADPKDFIGRDQAVMSSATQNVKAPRPENASPAAAEASATRQIQEAEGAARSNVIDRAQALAAGEANQFALADAFSGTRSLDQASRDLNRAIVTDTYLPDRAAKNAAYDAAAADPNVVVRTENVNRAADEALAENRMLNPALRDSRSTSLADAFTAPGATPTANAGGGLPSVDVGPQVPPTTRTLAEAMRDRAALSRTESEARAQGNFAGADTAASLRRGINADIRTAAESGVPGTEGLQRADALYRNDFAPTYREGYVNPDFFKAVDRGESLPPETTAGKYLVGGPASRAAAEDLSRVIARAPDPAAATAAATDYVLSDAVRAGIIQNGKISENRLARFMAAREGMFSQIPEIKARFDQLLAGTRSGNAQMQQLTADLQKASDNLKLTESQINGGVLKMIAGADPRVAVDSVFSSRNPAARMKEATAAFAHDPAASAGWKAAVSDWMVDKVTMAGKASVSAGEDAMSLAALRRTFHQNEAALAEVFSPEEMQILRQAQTRLEVLSRKGMQASSGSATAETAGGMRGVLTALAGPVGTVTAVVRGALIAGSLERRVRIIAEQFPDTNAAAAKLIRRAMFDPRIMKLMLDFPTSDAQMYTWSANLNRLLSVQSGAENSGRTSGE